jgi:protoporphyrinogen oxidase
MATTTRVLVLGAGPTGILTAWALKEKGITDVCIVEKTDSPGGLAKSRKREGWRVDFGPHRFQTRDERIRTVIEQILGTKLRVVTSKRIGIWLGGRPVDYPPGFSQLARAFPSRETLKCGVGYLRSRLFRSRSRPIRTYEDWLLGQYGNRFYQTTLAPMARKMWGLEPAALSQDLAAERVVLGASLRGLVFGSILSSGYQQYQKTFFYPTRYLSEIWDNAAAKLLEAGVGLKMNSVPVSVRVDRNIIASVTVQTEDEELEFSPDYVVSTIPLPDLTSALGLESTGETHPGLEQLTCRALVIVYIELRVPRLSPFHYIYFPQPEYVFQRLFEQKNFAQQQGHPETTVIGAEISCFEGDEVWRASDEDLFRKVVAGFERAELAAESQIRLLFTAREPNAYPMYTRDYRDALETALDQCGRIDNLLLNGRQGLFKFNNMDHCVEMGLAAAEHIAVGQPPEQWQASIRAFKQFKVID